MGEPAVSVRGYMIFVPFENIASMEYGSSGAPDKVTVATTPGHVAGPFEVESTVQDAAEMAEALRSAVRSGAIRELEAIGHLMGTCAVSPEAAASLMAGDGQ
jgi:predicted phage tail protein